MSYAKVDHGVWCIRPDGHFLEEVVVFSPSGGRATPHIHTNMSATALERISVPNVSNNWQEFRANLERKGFTVLSDDPTDEDIDLIKQTLRSRYREGIRSLENKLTLEFRLHRELDDGDPQLGLCEKRISSLSAIIYREQQRSRPTRQAIVDYLAQRGTPHLP